MKEPKISSANVATTQSGTLQEIKPYQLLLHLSLKYYSWPLSVCFSNLQIHKQK